MPLRAGPWLTTASVLRGAVEVRLVRVDPAGDATDTVRYTLRVGGYPLAGAQPPAVDERDATVRVTSVDAADLTGAADLTSVVAGLIGLCSAGAMRRIGGNAYGRFSAVPFVTCGRQVVFGRVYAAAVLLSAGPVDLTSLPTVDAGPAGTATRVLVRWPDGDTDQVDLDPVDVG